METLKEQQRREEREQREADALYMRKLDKKRKIEKHVVENPMLEINARIIQYEQQFEDLSLDNLALQAIRDFNQFFIPLQAKKLDGKKPIAIIRETQKKVYVKQDVNRLDLREPNFIYFLIEDLVGVK